MLVAETAVQSPKLLMLYCIRHDLVAIPAAVYLQPVPLAPEDLKQGAYRSTATRNYKYLQSIVLSSHNQPVEHSTRRYVQTVI